MLPVKNVQKGIGMTCQRVTTHAYMLLKLNCTNFYNDMFGSNFDSFVIFPLLGENIETVFVKRKQ